MSRLLLDVETFALDEAGQYIEEPTAPANYKDEAKIAAYIRERKAELLTKCALDLDLCRVVCAAWSTDDGETVDYQVANNDFSERVLLEVLGKRIAAASQIFGFNILEFDLPVLVRRAQYLGVDFPGVALDRYRTPHIDLMQYLAFNDKKKTRSLDFYTRRFGLPGADATNGADIDALVKARDWKAVSDHCVADVRKVAALAQRLKLIAAPQVEEVF